MPELPEVEYARRQLQRVMAGARITRVLLRRTKLRQPFPPDFVRRLEGQQVRSVTRRAKYLMVEVGSGDRLLMHLGMSGSFRVLRSGRGTAPGRNVAGRGRRALGDIEPFEKHDHVVFEMSNGAVVAFNDPRRFGFMTVLAPAAVEAHRTLGRLGPEPLARRFDIASLAAELGRRKASLKIALSDQRVIAGLGNIYASEALHRARLSPRRSASTLATKSGEPRPKLHDLIEAIREVLRLAIRNQYRTGVDNPFTVYDREGEACPRRGCTGTIRRIVQGGRSTFYCSTCQR